MSEKSRADTPLTNEHFAAFMKKMVGAPYWYGTCLYKCTESLRKKKAKQYPTYYEDSRTARYEKDIAAKKVCADCIGAAKGYAWTNGGQTVLEAIGTDEKITSRYGANGCPDKGANGMFAYAKQKGKAWGDIKTIPEVEGLAVTRTGHVGYYMGGGKVIEFKGFNYGCVETELAKGKWTSWYELPFIDYGDAIPADAGSGTETVALGSRLLKRGSSGDDVKELQRLLMELGYDLGDYGADGKFGAKTEEAVKRFQAVQQLKVDGKYGNDTHTALMGVVADRKEEPDEDEPDADETPVAVITRDDAEVYAGPDTTYALLTCVSKGDIYPYIATAYTDDWHAVKAGETVGWIRGADATVISTEKGG